MSRMSREEAISIIECLFPADSQYQESREIGKKFLQQAKDEANNWRNEPDNILFRYADLCMQEEDKTTMQLIREARRKGG